MAGEAHITDVAALEEFRRALIRFREEIGVAIAEAGGVGARASRRS